MWHYCCILTTTVNDMPTVSDLTVWLVSLDGQQRHLTHLSAPDAYPVSTATTSLDPSHTAEVVSG